MKKLLLLTAIAAASLLPTAAKADVLLLVDLSVLNRITVTSTSGLSMATISGSDNTGFYLQNFFNTTTAGTLGATGVTGNITSFLNLSDGTPAPFRGGGDPGFNIFSYTNDATSDFTSGVQAFSGSLSFTVSAVAYNQAVAAMGAAVSRNVYFPADTVDDLPNATILGTWQVVPEPSSVALGLTGLGGLLWVRLRRKK